MMYTMMVGYDLNKAGKNYDDLITSIKSLGAWWHYLDSTWLVKTSLSTSDVRDKLGRYIDTDDELLVIDVTKGPAAWKGFDESAAKWLRDNL